ncbi:hypothetical protein FD755_017205 [Muntiacus reevesi]|uniref:Large ribosomal subunit protein bL9m n=1 Tax=Muntiacus reevesi TaxID=9886 RepID=A0A5N3XAS1_MUNRE|nr:hypothetical protein FD755_017205 [Muntiacus reevesi]
MTEWEKKDPKSSAPENTAGAAFAVPGGIQLRVFAERLLRGGVRELLRPALVEGAARGEGRKPRLHRRHRVYKLVEDTKHRPKGIRGDLVSVKKSVGRNRLLPEGLAVYASPENKKLSCHLEVGMKNNVKWELNPEIAARHFLRNLGVVVAPHALKLPEEPITQRGEFWCEVTVNGLDTVKVPVSVVNFERPQTKRYKYWLAQQAAKGMASTSFQKI